MKMRKLIAMLAAVLMLCTIIPMGAVSVAAAAAVYSWDFENGLNTWHSGSDSSPMELVAAADLPVANPNGGDYAAKQTLNGYHYMSDTDSFEVEPNTDYVITVDALMGTNNWPVEVIIGTNSWLGSTVFKSGQVKISSASWTTLTYIFNSGNNTKLYAGFKSSWENVTVYFDNYTVAPCDSETMGNTDGYIYNGDFETGSATPWGTSANAAVVADPTGAGKGNVMQTNENTGSVTMFSQAARNLKANTYYKLSFQVYGYTTAVSNAAFWVQFPKTVTDWTVDLGSSGFTSQSANEYTPRINVNTKLNAWYDVSITFNTGDLTEVLINFMNYRANGGQYYFDNIKVREVKAPTFDGYITNGNFETGDLTGWTVTGATYAEVDGNTVMQGTNTVKYKNFVHQIVTVEPNTNYAVAFKAKAVGDSGVARMYAGTGTGNTGNLNSTYTWNVTNTAWTNITVSFNSGENTQLYINLCQGKDNGGDIYYDDVLMWEVKDPSYDGYITNGDFETGTADGMKLASQTYVSAAAAKDGNFGLYMMNSAGNWGGVGSWTMNNLEIGATYKLEMDMKAISKGLNWTLWSDEAKTVKYFSGYFSTTEWTHIEKEFVATSTYGLLNINGGNTGVSEEVYLDNLKITKIKDAHTCNVVEQDRVEATCTTDGYISYACDCGLGAYTEPIPAKGHTAGAAADCENAQVCTVCGAELVAALGHDWDDATCTAPKTCSVCGATDGDALGHTPGAAADCDSAQVCTVCGAELVAALGHNWDDATCTAPKTCSVCGATDGDALGHTPGAAADCENAQVCTVCGAELVAALGHDWDDATCTAPKTCSTCGLTEGDALGHSYTETSRVDATCGADGSVTYTCGNCGGSYSEPIAATGEHVYFDDCSAICEACGYEREAGHNVIYVEAVAPTCIGMGNLEYWYCDVCGMAWLDEACTMNTNLRAVKLAATGEHTYADDLDASCDICDATREIVAPVIDVKKSVSTDVNGLAFRFEADVAGFAIKEGTYVWADYTNATYMGYKLIETGVIASNYKSSITIKGERMCDLDDETGKAMFAYRIINIPADKLDVEITMQPYYIVEIDGEQVTLYGEEQTGSYTQVGAE